MWGELQAKNSELLYIQTADLKYPVLLNMHT
jgi:hypothetical protein